MDNITMAAILARILHPIVCVRRSVTRPTLFAAKRSLSVRHRPEDLERAFFSTRFTRVLDSSGYARIRHWKIYAEEGLANREVVLWLGSEVLTVEYAGEPLARYDVEYSPRTKNLREVRKPQLFGTSHRVGVAQLRLFELEALGEMGWLKALRLDEYSPQSPRRSQVLQQTLFACSEAP